MRGKYCTGTNGSLYVCVCIEYDADMTALDAPPSRAYTNDRSHVFHSWSAQGALNPIVVAGAEGSWFWDENGKRYLVTPLNLFRPADELGEPLAKTR